MIQSIKKLIPEIHTSIVILIFLLMAGLSCNVLADAGKVIFSLGKVHALSPQGKPRILKRGSVINAGDTIVTNKLSMLQMRMKDKGFVALRSNTKFKIDEFVYKKNIKKDRSNFNLLKGGFRAITGFIGKRNHAAYRVKTISATIGIRGTDFTVRLCDNDCEKDTGSAENGLYVGVTKGGVSITNEAGVLDLNPLENGFVKNSTSRPQALKKAPLFLFMKAKKMKKNKQGDSSDNSRQRANNRPNNGRANNEQNTAGDRREEGGNQNRQTTNSEAARATEEGNKLGLTFSSRLSNQNIPDAVLNSNRLPEVVNRYISNQQGQDLAVDNNPIVEFTRIRRVAMATDALPITDSFSASNLNVQDRVAVNATGVTAFDITGNAGNVFEISMGSAANRDIGADPVSGIVWGRWSGGDANLRLPNGSQQSLDLSNSSIHWVVDPNLTDSNIVLPRTGTYRYELVGNTPVTDNLGNSNGVLGGNASLVADFNSMTVDTQIDLSIADNVWNAAGSGAPIRSNGTFASDLNVNINAAGTALSGQGSVNGFFTENAQAAGLGYSMSADINGVATTVSGIAAFRPAENTVDITASTSTQTSTVNQAFKK